MMENIERKDDLMALMKVHDLTESYDEMFNCLKEISTIEFDFSNEEIELMNRTFKLLIGKKRHERSTLATLLSREIENGILITRRTCERNTD